MSMDSSRPPSVHPLLTSPSSSSAASSPLPVSTWLPSHPATPTPHFSGKPSSTTAYLGFLRPMTKASRILRTSLGWMSLGEGGGSFSCDFPSTRLPSFSALRSSGSCSGDTDARNQCGQRCKGNYGWKHECMKTARKRKNGENVYRKLQKLWKRKMQICTQKKR